MDAHSVDARPAMPAAARLTTAAAQALGAVVDAVDLETCLFCQDETEARRIILQLLGGLGFEDADVVSVVHRAGTARVRARVYVNRPGAAYPWSGEAPRR